MTSRRHSECLRWFAMRLLECAPVSSRAMLAIIVFTTGLITLVYVLDVQQLQGLKQWRTAALSTRWVERTWTWSCEEQTCLRREWTTSKEPGRPRWTSLATCRMTCGSGRIVWPAPTGIVSLGDTWASFSLPRVKLKVKQVASEDSRALVVQAFDIFKANLLATSAGGESSGTGSNRRLEVKVIVVGGETRLSLTTEESYQLVVAKKADARVVALIAAPTFYGVRHGLETLSQLVWFDEGELGGGVFRVLDNVTVRDNPRFAYRGLMVDTARNFLPVPALRRTVDGMAASKLNTLHLHLTDSQSFPFEPRRHPQLARYGAYSPDEVYTVRDIAELTRYANVRGVRILAEVDAPAHSGNGWQWGESHNLGVLAVCVNRQPWQEFCGQPPCGQLNPSNNNTYDILRGIYQDIAEATNTTDLFHMGGDEINAHCWQSSRDVFPDHPLDVTAQEFWDKVREFHVRALGEMVAAHGGRKPGGSIVWSNSDMPVTEFERIFPRADYVVQEWGGSTWESTRQHLALNYRVIISHVDAWYFDCGFGPSSASLNEPCGPIATLKKVFEHRPWSAYPEKKQPLVLGGEGCLWSEKVDSHSLDSRLWPRASALAGRLWSDPEGDEPWSSTYLQLSAHRARLVARGVGAAVVGPRWCEENPGEC